MSEKEPSSIPDNQEKNSSNLSIQETLSIGYVLLIIIGIYLEFIKYHVFGINIVEHSDFLDFLIAPFKNAMLVLIIGFYHFTKRYENRGKKTLDEENINLQIKSKDSPQKPKELPFYQGFLFWLTLLFTSMNLGAGLGTYFSAHGKMKEKIDANITNAKISFIDNQTKEVYILGKNTSNVFYFENGNIDLIICPIAGNVKSIQYIPKDKQKQLPED